MKQKNLWFLWLGNVAVLSDIKIIVNQFLQTGLGKQHRNVYALIFRSRLYAAV